MSTTGFKSLALAQCWVSSCKTLRQYSRVILFFFFFKENNTFTGSWEETTYLVTAGGGSWTSTCFTVFQKCLPCGSGTYQGGTECALLQEPQHARKPNRSLKKPPGRPRGLTQPSVGERTWPVSKHSCQLLFFRDLCSSDILLSQSPSVDLSFLVCKIKNFAQLSWKIPKCSMVTYCWIWHWELMIWTWKTPWVDAKTG